MIEDEQADQHPADSPGADRLAAPAAGQVDGERVEGEGDQRQDQREALQRVDRVLRGRELVGFEQLDLRRVGRQLVGDVDAELVAEAVDDRPEVERDVAAFGRERVAAAFDHFEEERVGVAVRFRPERLHLRPGQRLGGEFAGELRRPAAAGPASGLAAGGSAPASSPCTSTFS